MSKVIFAAWNNGDTIPPTVSAVAFAWDENDPRVVNELQCSEGHTSDELLVSIDAQPPGPGLWIWEGEIETAFDEYDPEDYADWTGTWRRPTPYELAEISEGRWPEKDDESPGALGCNYKRGKPGTGSTACPGKRSDLAKCMSCKDFNLNAWWCTP